MNVAEISSLLKLADIKTHQWKIQVYDKIIFARLAVLLKEMD